MLLLILQRSQYCKIIVSNTSPELELSMSLNIFGCYDLSSCTSLASNMNFTGLSFLI